MASKDSAESKSTIQGIAVETMLDSRMDTCTFTMDSTMEMNEPEETMDHLGEEVVTEPCDTSPDPALDCHMENIEAKFHAKNVETLELTSSPLATVTDKKSKSSSLVRGTKPHHEYINVGIQTKKTPPPRQKSSLKKVPSDDDLYYSYRHRETSDEGGIHYLLKHVNMLEKRNVFLEEMNKKLRRENSMLNHQLQDVLRHTTKESELLQQRRNSKEIIAEYDCQDVQALLYEMGLSQYIVTFANERINGPLLLELDEVILEMELGVYSTLHRKRLMRVIEGSHHISDIMTEDICKKTLV